MTDEPTTVLSANGVILAIQQTDIPAKAADARKLLYGHDRALRAALARSEAEVERLRKHAPDWWYEKAMKAEAQVAGLREALDRLARVCAKTGPMGRIADLGIGGAEALEQARAALDSTDESAEAT